MDGIDISTKVGELTTTDLNVENESRIGHTNARLVRDDFANKIQGCHTQARVAWTCVLCVLHQTFISHRSNQKYLAKSVRLSRKCWFWCHAGCVRLVSDRPCSFHCFQVSSLPVTTESKRVADPQFIHSRLQNLSLSPAVRTRMLFTAELEKNPTSGKRSYTNASVIGESGCRVWMMKHWYAQKKNFWTKH